MAKNCNVQPAPLADLEPDAFIRNLIQAAEALGDDLEDIDNLGADRFVPCEYSLVYQALVALRPQHDTLVEWGAGLGIVTGMAHHLGYRARGLELHAELATTANAFLGDFGLPPLIEIGNYHHDAPDETLVFAYPWPDEKTSLINHYRQIATPNTRLLLFTGPDECILIS